MAPTIRPATEDDAPAMLAVYAPNVADTAVSFELEPPTLDAFRARISDIAAAYPCLAAVDAGELVGYAWATPFRPRPAYRFTAETTVYVRRDAHRRGVGRALMQALLDELRRRGFRRAVAAITLPNAASVGLHEALGFVRVGVFEGVGRKFDRWHDVGFWEVGLAPPAD